MVMFACPRAKRSHHNGRGAETRLTETEGTESKARSVSELSLTIKKIPRRIFVAYPYRRYPPDDYRRPFLEVGKALQVSFAFADEQFSSSYLLDKIKAMILSSEFGIYDVTGWNANVSLELGLALGLGETCFISFDPSVEGLDDVPSDIRGRDRIQYSSLTHYQAQIEHLVNEHLPVPVSAPPIQVDVLRARVLEVLRDDAGLKIADIASALGINKDFAQLLIRPLVVEGKIRTTGATRAMRYFKQ